MIPDIRRMSDRSGAACPGRGSICETQLYSSGHGAPDHGQHIQSEGGLLVRPSSLNFGVYKL